MPVTNELLGKINQYETDQYSPDEIVSGLSSSLNHPDIAEKIKKYQADGYSSDEILSGIKTSPIVDAKPQPQVKEESYLGKASKGFADELAGIPETIASLGSSMLAQPISYLGGAAMTALKGGEEGKKFREYLSGSESPYVYQPRTEAGQSNMNFIGKVLSPLGWPRKIGESFGGAIDTATGNKTKDWEEGMGNVFEAPLQALGLKGGMTALENKGVISKTPEVKQAVPVAKLDKEISRIVNEDYFKAIRPTTGGKTTYNVLTNYGKRVGNAEKYIVNNKDMLEYVDNNTGELIKGELPKSVLETAQVWKQSMENIWQQANDLVQKKNGTGITISTTPLIRELTTLANKNKVASPSVTREALGLIERLKEKPNLTFPEVQEYLGQINTRLGKQSTATYSDYGSMQVDSAFAKYLRGQLDKNIDGIKELRNTYADFKAAEADITRAAAKRLNIDPQKMDFLDIGAVTYATHSALSLNPAGLATAGVLKSMNLYRKMKRDPDYIIKNMYEKIDKVLGYNYGFNEAFRGGLPIDEIPKKQLGWNPQMGMEDVSGQPSKYTPPITQPTMRAIPYDISKNKTVMSPMDKVMADASGKGKAMTIKDARGRNIEVIIPYEEWNNFLLKKGVQ